MFLVQKLTQSNVLINNGFDFRYSQPLMESCCFINVFELFIIILNFFLSSSKIFNKILPITFSITVFLNFIIFQLLININVN